MLNQTFGVELECYPPRGLTMDAVARLLTEAGVVTHAEGYNHFTRATWKIVTDGSLSSRGMEIVSPVLTGAEGIRQMRVVCDTLTKIGCTVNRSCGMHVHVGARGRTLAFFQRLLKAYAHFEFPIDGTLPLSRRAQNNSFCRSMRGFDAQIDNARSIDDLVRTFNRIGGRYYKLNLQSFVRHGTVEFRQHSGTTDADKAEAWVMFCLAMCEKANHAETVTVEAGTEYTQAEPQAIVYRGHLVTPEGWRGRWACIQLMRRPEGATEAELLAVMPWCQSARAAFSCKIFGYRHVARTINGETRHFAVNPNPRVPVATRRTAPAPLVMPDPTLEGLILYANLPAAVASHMRARTAHFAGRA